MYISQVRISNFRNLANVGFSPHRLTLLVGENETGKTNFLSALDYVLNPERGMGRIQLFRHDFFDPARPIEITLTLSEPTPEDHAVFTDLFEFDEAANEVLRVGFRYQIDEHDDIVESVLYFPKHPHRRLSQEHRGQIPFYLQSAVRELRTEFSTARGALFGRLLRQIDLSDVDEEITEKLNEVNRLLEEHPRFRSLIERLTATLRAMTVISPDATRLIGAIGAGDPKDLIANIRLHVERIATGDLLPLSRLGAGAQNLLMLAAYRAFVEGAKGASAILGIEEPEAHLHPHRQRLVASQLVALSREQQVFVSTHSTFVTQMIDPHDIVLFRLSEGQTITKQLPPGYLNAEDLAKLRRFYDPSGAEMFFAKCVLLVEGDSERAALPEIARKLVVDPANPQSGQMDLDLRGISVISVDGKDNFRNFLKPLTAEAFDIPWVLVCDDDALDAVLSQLTGLGVIDSAEWEGTPSKDDMKAILRRANTICLAGDLEDSYLAAVPEQELLSIIDAVDGAGAVQRYVQQRSASDPTYGTKPSTRHIHDYIKHRGKPYLARRIAESIVPGSVPSEIEEVLRLATASAG